MITEVGDFDFLKMMFLSVVKSIFKLTYIFQKDIE